ncbi:hypothetical protein [Gardnerella vaginalis]|uniref:hypothetical protein n=1 Tax=Gardnerella vaginalis TaxID=2702 RepID=UPI0015738438|nr:hypothetical protein [Gardnerella vaginalis]NSX24289.1 hypothetical protein [Gardnerella vaginalis]
MMNKKAIAAFAAGATLLAGFAMATPAFAGAKGDALADCFFCLLAFMSGSQTANLPLV